MRTRGGMGLMLGVLLLMGTANASDLRDAGKLFSDGAAQDARQRLQAVEDKTGVETLIFTAAEAGQKTFASDHEKNKYFQNWLMDLAKEANARGVVILVCKSPGRVQIDFHKELFAKGWPKGEPAAIRDRAMPALKSKDFDKALASFVASVERQSEKSANAPPAAMKGDAPAAGPVVWNDPATWTPAMKFVIVVLCVIGAVLVISLIFNSRAKAVYQGGGSYGTGYGGSSGGYVPARPSPSHPAYAHGGSSPAYSAPSPAPAPQRGGVDLGSAALGGVAGYMLGSQSHRSHEDDRPRHRESSSSHESYSAPSPSYDPPSSSDSGGGGFDFGGGGGDFSGGSGGDF